MTTTTTIKRYRVTVTGGGWHDCYMSLGPDWDRHYCNMDDADAAADDATDEARTLAEDGDHRFADFAAGVRTVEIEIDDAPAIGSSVDCEVESTSYPSHESYLVTDQHGTVQYGHGDGESIDVCDAPQACSRCGAVQDVLIVGGGDDAERLEGPWRYPDSEE